jgi:hypothetical protein
MAYACDKSRILSPLAIQDYHRRLYEADARLTQGEMAAKLGMDADALRKLETAWREKGRKLAPYKKVAKRR